MNNTRFDASRLSEAQTLGVQAHLLAGAVMRFRHKLAAKGRVEYDLPCEHLDEAVECLQEAQEELGIAAHFELMARIDTEGEERHGDEGVPTR